MNVFVKWLLLSDLRVVCRNKNLPVSATKAALIERILSGTCNEGNELRDKGTITVVSVVMKTWFMAPYKSEACREGTLNKPLFHISLRSFQIKVLHVWHLKDVRSKLRPFTTLDYVAIPMRSWLRFHRMK
jgi:hypothetical protein